MTARPTRAVARIAVPSAIRRALVFLCPGIVGVVAVVVVVVAGPTLRGVAAGDESEQGTACSVPAFVPDDDATLVAAYDGLRRGLEEAHLPRVCRRRVEGSDAAAWEPVARDVSARGAAFLVVFGRGFADRAASAPFLRTDGTGRIPCVYVDASSTAAGVAWPERADPAPPCAVVRAESPIEAAVAVIRRLFPAKVKPVVRLAWETDVPATRAWRDAIEAAGVRTRFASLPNDEDAILDAPLGLGERPQSFEAALARARASGIPLVSLDRGRFGRGAAVVICPDGALLGRMAAEAARRLRDGEGADKALRLSVRTVEVLVDLDAADAQGIPIPLALVASADRVRTSKVRSRPAGEPRAGSGK